MRKTQVALVLLFAGIIVGSYYYVIATSPDTPPIINSHQLSSATNMSWDLTSTSKISKITNLTVGKRGFSSGIQRNFELGNNTSTTLSVNVIYFGDSTDANNTYINLTNSFFEGFSSNFPHNSTISNGSIHDIIVQPSNFSNGIGRTINYTTLVAVHKNILVEVMESVIFLSGSCTLRILNWELKASQ